MEFKTKFSFGQTLWSVRNCKAFSFVVKAIVKTEKAVMYGESYYTPIPEDQCFSTLEALVESLTNNERD